MALTISDGGGIRTLTLDDVKTRNAMTPEDVSVLLRAVTDVPVQVRALVLQGANGAFSSGLHLNTFTGLDRDGARDMISRLGAAISAVRTLGIPTVAVLDGPCMGAALELAAACDLRIGTTRVTLGMPEVRLGFPSVLDAALLSQFFGLSLAKEMLLTGRSLDFERWHSLGFLNQVAGPESLQAAVAATVEELLDLPRPAYAAQKRLLENWQNHTLADSLKISVEEFATSFDARAEAGARP